MSEYLELLSIVAVSAASIAGVGHSIAAIIRETYRGKALLIRAKKDPAAISGALTDSDPDPPPPDLITLGDRILRLLSVRSGG